MTVSALAITDGKRVVLYENDLVLSIRGTRLPLLGCQVRMARAALSLSLAQLAQASGLAEKTIRRCEAACGRPRANSQTLMRLKATFEAHGVRFIPATGRANGPGIALDWDPTLGEVRADVLTPNEIALSWHQAADQIGHNSFPVMQQGETPDCGPK